MENSKVTTSNKDVQTKENAPKIIHQRNTLQGMSKRDMKRMCEALKSFGVKYKADANEKIIINNFLSCTQNDWAKINDVDNNLIQL